MIEGFAVDADASSMKVIENFKCVFLRVKDELGLLNGCSCWMFNSQKRFIIVVRLILLLATFYRHQR